MPAAQLYTAGYTTTVCVVQSKGRQQEPTALTAARLIGYGGCAAAAAGAAVGYTTTRFFLCRQRCFARRYTAE